jgi:hypothetical protein
LLEHLQVLGVVERLLEAVVQNLYDDRAEPTRVDAT